MTLKTLKSIYPAIVFSIVLIPNIFVIICRIESFPFTCAPMFGHYINDETDLYLFKFEGENESSKVDLVDYYGTEEIFFMRHFLSKVYGTTESISPFNNKLSESESDFNLRMNTFFIYYSNFLLEHHKLNFDKINLQVKKVDKNRNSLSGYETIGIYDCGTKTYNSFFKRS